MSDLQTARILDAVESEVDRATALHGPFRSAHEGYAVLLEEVEELWAEVRKRRGERSASRLREESIQIAAMAVRFVRDLDLYPELTEEEVAHASA